MSDLVVAEGLRKSYRAGRGRVAAVDGVSLHIEQGSTLALVGESGCGKSTTGRLLLALERPDDGSVEIDGRSVLGMGKRELRELRRTVAPVFQDPYDSINGRWTVSSIVAEPLRVHGFDDVGTRVRDLLDAVGLPAELATRHPHELSGGQRQRVAIARAIATGPDFLVCDEPVSALDVSVQAQIVNLLRRIQSERGITYLFISHDLALVRHVADRVAVMYLGRIVEEGATDELFADPRHPYTQLLLAAAPRPRVRTHDAPARPEPVVAQATTVGCRFAPRCPLATDRCRTEDPALRGLGEGRGAACHYAETARVGAV